MRFREIFRYELAYQIRRVWTGFFFSALTVLAFLMTRDGSLAEALYDDFFLNSPFAIAKTTVVGSLVWLLVVAVVAGEAGARDVATGMYSLIYTASVSKVEYLAGRFLAAFVLNALILLAVQVGILLGVYLPGVDAALIGPFRPVAYLTAYGFIALPNALAATAIQFGLAVRSGRPMASYLGSLLLFFLAYVVSLFLLFQGRQDLANLLDPIGVHFILSDLSHGWTTVEKSWRLLELEGVVLRNRLLWLSIAVVALVVTYRQFRFVHRGEGGWWKRITRPFHKLRTGAYNRPRTTPVMSAANEGNAPVALPPVPHPSGLALPLRQTLAVAGDSFRTIATSWAGLFLLVAIPLMMIPVILDQMETNGVPLVPITIRVIGELTAPLSAELSRWVIIPLLIVFFAGELVWREREAGLSEINDAMPTSDWATFLGKFGGLSLVLVLFMALLMAAGMLAQFMLGYQNVEIGLYLTILFGLQLPEYLLFALLALVVHGLVNQKYIGHLVAIMAYVVIIVAPMFGIEHNLLLYSAGPPWAYTQMRGFGPTLGPWLWFKLYWVAWAVLLAVVVRLLWVRGKQTSTRERLRLACRRFTRPTIWTASAAGVLILTLGGFIVYNTNVLNEYRTAAERKEQQAEYERRYGRYAGRLQPRLASINLHVEIYPERRAVDIRGTYHLVNRGTVAIDSVHLATVSNAVIGEVAFNRPARLLLADDELGHRIYALNKPLQPGDSLRLDFRVRIEPRGFRESGIDASVVANGTYFTNGAWLPAIGYQRSRELLMAADRRAHKLTPRPIIEALADSDASQDLNRSGGVALNTIVGTSADQVAVAPGALRRTWTKGGRRYFQYATDGPIGNEYAFFSANYAMREARWQNVTIRIFHDPKHTAHVDRMVQGIRASLAYYTQQFGPYRYRHLTVVERGGGPGTGMHAEASMLSHGESFPFWIPADEQRSLDLPYAVVAHEMAHQWTVPYAFVEGAPVMSESIAWYYGMKLVEHARGPEQLRRLLNFMRQPYPYPPIRRGEPLLRGLDPYMSYRRGPFALYALSEYIGEERVNGALRHLLETHRKPGAPLATTLDLYRELQTATPDSLRYLLHDLFEVNTYWELETKRATATQTRTGPWRVKLDVEARKVVDDSAGVETEVPMNDWVEVGVFAPAGKGEPSNKSLYLRKHRIRSGRQTITVTVPVRPTRASIDPNHLLIDLKPENNTKDL